MDRRDTLFLDWMRGLAAVSVVVHHARNRFHGGADLWRASGDSFTFFENAQFLAFAPFRYGGAAVILFFVISGFVIHLRYARRYAEGPSVNESTGDQNTGDQSTGDLGFDGKDYLVRRFRRVYPTLIAAILITFAVDFFGMAINGATYDRIMESGRPPAHDFWTVVGNLAFLSAIFVPALGTNGPLWSLAIEWWVYMIYPLLSLISKASIRWATLFVMAIAALELFPWVSEAEWSRRFVQLIAPWWMGALIAECYAGRWRHRNWLRSIRWLTPLAVVAPVLNHPFVWGLAFAGLIATCIEWNRDHDWKLNFPRFNWLGDCSFTLYIIHSPLLFLLMAVLSKFGYDLEQIRHYGWALLSSGISIVLCHYLHYLIEAPFNLHNYRRSVTGT